MPRHGLAAATLLPSRPDPDLDRFARLATVALRAPVGLVSMVSAEEQVFPGAVGLPEPWQSRRATPLTHSLCRHVVTSGGTFTVADARQDPLTADSLAIPDLGVVAYAGAPVRLADPSSGEPAGAHHPVVGVLCAIDDQPRSWTPEQVAVLEDLAAACSAELSLRVVQERQRLLLALAETLVGARSVPEVDAAVTAVTRAQLGGARSVLLLRTGPDRALHPRPAADGDPPGWPVTRLDGDSPVAAAARARRPLLFADRAQLDAAFPPPAAREAPARSEVPGASAFLPLAVAGQPLGVLVLLWPDERPGLRAEEEVWGALARFTAQAVHRAQLEERHRTHAEVLQRSLLPTLPHVDSLRTVGRYVPAAREEQVGGDWYDAVVLPDGALNLVVGDVAGHDARAAGTMGQVRGLLRAFAWDRPEPPTDVVGRLDRALLGLGVDALATLVLARVEQDAAGAARGARRLRWTNAGHPPPVLLRPDGSTELLRTPPNLLVGLLDDAERHDHDVDVPDGSVLLLYTDGLIEQRGRSLAGGLERVRATLTRLHRLPLEDLLDALLAELVGTRGEDDCALLAVAFDPQPRG
ncbi:SpoIIE family protein phosphatase [Paenibacillus sp. TRM 82003]|uniref:GAF domain-containing SpoIIE family protein phosphatase n=1 Tax=Kineococcus sp. TRM81007 TaxID=2925831 RepID=UPI001F5A2F13|nr:GAF domain-containing SpoIIE family protein phosphatase [Kineococcus sp. TRM81007]MCI2236944.1 SpoIIE family protein phosphatase [Kineococcus sp. TRM81007]MCI3926399.1 SpoIIE family protein phosphatase [Paenibacillus sp. TRM 82003]